MNKDYSIMGVKMTGSEYQRISSTINIMETEVNWNPTEKDVINLLHNDRHPSKEIRNDMKNLQKMCRRDAKY